MWKYLSGASTDWDFLFESAEGIDVLNLVNNDLEEFPHKLVSKRNDEDSLQCLYITDNYRLRLESLAPLYITEPRLVTDNNEQITWNC